MVNQQTHHPAIVRYLSELELTAKQCVGVIPHQILRDAEEHLTRDCDSLLRVDPSMDDDSLLAHFCTTFGDPASVAKSYEQYSLVTPSAIPAKAPNWRIHCGRCGMSAPAAKAGITRIGARSKGKRVLGWCRECNRFRWLHLTRDLNRPGTIDRNEELSQENVSKTQKSSNASKTRTINRLILLVTTLILAALTVLYLVSRAQADQPKTSSSNAPGLNTKPDGWKIESEFQVNATQLSQLSKKVGVPLKSVFNTVVSLDDRKLQINTITVQNANDADALLEAIRKGKHNPRWVVRNQANIYEFVVRTAEDARVAAVARYAFPIHAATRSYRVSFDAIPIKSERDNASPDARNRLFNLLLAQSSNTTKKSDIASLASDFEFSDSFNLVHDMQGSVRAVWKSTEAKTELDDVGEFVHFQQHGSKTRFGMPIIDVAADITIDLTATRKVDSKVDKISLLAPNKRFPTQSPELKRLVKNLVTDSDSDDVKLRKLLNWFSDSQNIKYDGLMGARYGANVAFAQHFGRCWDFADLFITMSRIAGLPARQVYGWLYESEGHVWCDVIVDGHWQMVDPTSGTIVGSDYIPFFVSADGEFPIVYASQVRIEAN